MKNVKEVLTIAYGIIGMFVFFTVLFFGGNAIISFIGLYYRYLFFIGLPLIAVFWLILKLKK